MEKTVPRFRGRGGDAQYPRCDGQGSKALNEHNIEIKQTGDSNITISLLIKQDDLRRAVQTIHDSFVWPTAMQRGNRGFIIIFNAAASCLLQ